MPIFAEVAEIDIWFPVLHGPNGEDGTVQGLFTLLQMPFVGSGVLGASLGMDKIAMKQAFAQAGLPQVNYLATSRAEVWSNPCVFPKLCDRIEAELGYPCFVKPANLGSSVGISKAATRDELEAALDNAASYDRRIIVGSRSHRQGGGMRRPGERPSPGFYPGGNCLSKRLLRLRDQIHQWPGRPDDSVAPAPGNHPQNSGHGHCSL